VPAICRDDGMLAHAATFMGILPDAPTYLPEYARKLMKQITQPGSSCWINFVDGELQDKYGSRYHGSPQLLFVADRGLRDIQRTDDFIGNLVDLLFLIPACVRIEIHAKGGSQHLRGQLFCVIAGLFIRLPISVMLAQVSEEILVFGDCQTDRRSNEPVGLICGILAHDAENDLARLQVSKTLAARDQFRRGRVNARYAYQVEFRYACLTQGHFKAGKFFPMLADAFSQKDFFCNHEIPFLHACYPALFESSPENRR
jgi:hypothetical protein